MAYDDYECEFASEDVRAKVIEHNRRKLEGYFRNIVKYSEGNIYFGQLKGRLFEDLAHKMIQEGGKFLVHCLSSTTDDSEITFADLLLTELKSQDYIPPPSTLKVETYFKPIASNFGAVDALVISPVDTDPPILLQMMTGK